MLGVLEQNMLKIIRPFTSIHFVETEEQSNDVYSNTDSTSASFNSMEIPTRTSI